MTLPKPYYQSERVTLYHGDCLAILPHLEKVDTVVTDPPYGINTKSDGAGKLNPWADLCNSAFWYTAWFRECRRVSRSMWACFNWRSMVTFQKAACDASWPIESVLVWHKDWIGPGGCNGLRPSYEMVGLWCNGATVVDRGIPDMQTFKWSSHKPTGHPAEKPVDLMQFCMDAVQAQTVLDPFTGSGTTGVACIKTGRKFIGIEIDEKYCEIAAKRIQKAEQEAASTLMGATA
jgi:site-specific DNA-methyltransferase (adenine-specific)